MNDNILARIALQALLDAAVDAIILIDHRGTILAMNRSAEGLFRLRAQEALGDNVRRLMPPELAQQHDGFIARFIATREARVIGTGREVEAQRADGTRFPARLSIGEVAGSDPPHFVGFIHDLTQQREIETEGRRVQERLSQVARFAALGEMAAGVAHELNQPLSAIATYAQACDRMLQAPDADLPEVRDALKQISAQALRAGEIIHRLRYLMGGRETERRSTDINVVVEDLPALTATDLRQHRATLQLDLAEGLPTVAIDRVQVQQVLLNLVRNALEALTESAAQRRDIIVSTQLVEDGEVEIDVRDHGPGVDEATVARMFDPFYTTKREGTGLGLAISRTIARAHQGKLGYRAAEGGGAVFFLRLPVEERSES
jgi:two-component system sensor kinase FixL